MLNGLWRASFSYWRPFFNIQRNLRSRERRAQAGHSSIRSRKIGSGRPEGLSIPELFIVGVKGNCTPRRLLLKRRYYTHFTE